MRASIRIAVMLMIVPVFLARPTVAGPFSFSTGAPDGKIATGSRPSSAGKIEIESADDFILGTPTFLTGATFTGLLPANALLSDVGQVRVEIYRVFPKDSTNPPSGNVPVRTNSPSDVAFDDRDNLSGGLSFTSAVLNSSFSAANSVLNGINKKPSQTTGGEGAVSGQEVQFNVNFTKPFLLPADHYFFIPQVELSSGDFLWLSAPKPTSPPFIPDLQSWIRNEDLQPDWLRVGTDIVGPPSTGGAAPTFNASFSLSGQSVPEAGSAALLLPALSLLGLGAALRRMRRRC